MVILIVFTALSLRMMKVDNQYHANLKSQTKWGTARYYWESL